MELRGKRALVTGGASGLGRDLVGRFSQAGCQVVVLDLDATGLSQLKRELPEVQTYSCDVANSAEVERVIDEVFKEQGAVDVLINNAGVIFSAPLVQFTASGFKKHDFESWDRMMQINLSSVFYVTASVAERMMAKRTKGVIVNISSICAAGNLGQSAYSAAKAGVEALTRTWAKELGPLGIRVAAVAPGFVDTPSTAKALDEAHVKEWVKRVPLRRLGRAPEITDAVFAVLQNDFIHGKTLEVDGGLVV